jgi:hypothetical protein
MVELEYAEAVIARTHARTLAGELKWQAGTKSITAELINGITFSINYSDEGPDSAAWQYVMIKNPVGEGWTMVTNPTGPTAHLGKLLASGTMLDQINAIFRCALLEPRQKAFAAAMAALQES